MNFILPISIPKLKSPIHHQHKILLIGSCFTEHIAGFLNRAKFETMQNSHGVIFNPWSVSKALEDVVQNKKYEASDLFYLNEYWHSWNHHSDFSCLDKEESIQKINAEIESQHHFLKQADYIIITLGSAFAYYHKHEQTFVSNNHRAPLDWFEKKLLDIDYMVDLLNQMQTNLLKFNTKLQFIYTISPVRHSRDGVIENNRSKARLLEAVHSLKNAYYFPAYELVIDVLRDYRFYDLDMVHPNYQATAFVWENFVSHCIDENCVPLMKQLEQITKAKQHRPKDMRSEAHKRFMKEHATLCENLMNEFPYLRLNEEIAYFNN